MSSQRQVNFRDLVEEGKKRIVVLLICVVGLSYLMSLTSTSVLVNLPAAASLIILLRYFSLDFEMRRKAAAYNSKHSPENLVSQNKPPNCPKAVAHTDWRRNVNSPVVEDAIDKFTRHLVAEWVTDLWYSRLTPDKEGPEELVQIINGVLGEFSGRVRNINLVDLLTRDLVSIICTHLELFRASKAKIEKQHSEALTVERRDIELRRVLASSNKLHPALFSAEAEHKVLQFLMDSLISFTFKPQDLQCSFFRYIVRELLACAVMRPVLNLPSPRFINERIEGLAISITKRKGAMMTHETSQAKPDESSKISSDHFSRSVDPSVTGVELIQLKTDQAKSNSVASPADNQNGSHLSKDPLLSLDTRSTRSWGSLPMNPQASDEKRIQRHLSGGEWPDKLDLISHRKTQALAPEHFENMWTKGRNYKRKESEDRISEQYSAMNSGGVDGSKALEKPKEKDTMTKAKPTMVRTITDRYSDKLKIDNSFQHPDSKNLNGSSVASYPEEDDTELGSSNSYTSEDEETDSATGLDSPVTKVWDGKSNRNLSVSHIHHPLENPNGHISKKTSRRRVQHQRLSRTQSGRKRFRLSGQRLPIWQEVERTSLLPGDGQDVLNSQKGHIKVNESSTESESEHLSQSGEAASSCASFITVPENHSLTVSSMQNSLMVDSFFKLRCEVVGANIVKSDSRTFAVYSISVTDSNNNSWSIKRRFRHFEELHRRLKFFGEYDLHLPPKHFLSTGLDVSVIQERCKLLDSYLKKLLQIPRVSGSIEVWDFLSVDSQTYAFLNSFSIVETLSVDLEDKPSERSTKFSNSIGNLISPSSYRKEHLNSDSKESVCVGKAKDKLVAEEQKVNVKENFRSPASREHVKPLEDSRSGLDASLQKGSPSLRNLDKSMKGRQGDGLEETSDSLLDASNDPTLPSEWVPPNLSVPILDLVDVIFQLQDGGWIRRKAFWVAKQILQLGMGDAFDDWLIEKIQLLRRGSVLASGINRLEQILWPDGIFLTKHPKRRQPPPSSPSQSLDSPHVCAPAEISSPRSSEEQEEEADRRAKFVYELMIDKAPAPIVGLVGRKEYEQCAKDLYLFIQSSVCLKHLVFDLLELLLLSAFPEMEYAFKQVHEEKHRFGEFKEDL